MGRALGGIAAVCAIPSVVAELQGPSCRATIAVNGYSGRFGGAGTDGCDIVPEDSPPPWFVPSWE